MTSLVEVRDLVVTYPVDARRTLRAVDGASLSIAKGECLGLVGESGCGKSTLGRALTRLVDTASGTYTFGDGDALALRGEALRAWRRRVQIVFQDAGAALNPRHTIGAALREPLEIHALHPTRRDERVRELLASVGLRDDVLARYPHELSGGQKQRVGIARALAVEPEFIVLDEPVSALDASVRAQVTNLLLDLKEQLGLTLLFISHDLGVVRHVCSRVAVMYLGKIVEVGPVDDVMRAPKHPYTRALRASVPIADPTKRASALERKALDGEPASALAPPSGCRFHPRCPEREDKCAQAEPPLVAIGSTSVACIHA